MMKMSLLTYYVYYLCTVFSLCMESTLKMMSSSIPSIQGTLLLELNKFIRILQVEYKLNKVKIL